MDTLIVHPVRAADAGVADLIRSHFALMRESSPEDSCHVMPAETLDREGVRMFAAFSDDAVAGIGGVKEIELGHGEIKSMHTSPLFRGKGVARMILRALMAEASQMKLSRISLETGSAELFKPARALYASENFSLCDPFGDYKADPHSVFMTRELAIS